MNHLYPGDNLKVLPALEPASVDLCYLDPPFHSQRSYEAFDDTWSWDEEARRGLERIVSNESGLAGDPSIALFRLFEQVFRTDRQRCLLAYLVSLGERLLWLHRVLKPAASLYLHCDSTASHPLKLVLDSIFEPAGGEFLNEIIWKRAETVKGNFGQGSRRFDPATDTLLFYARCAGRNTFHPQFAAYDPEDIGKFYKYVEPSTGRRYQLISMTAPGDAAKGNPIYEVMGVRRYWRYSREKMQELIDAGLVVQTAPGNVPRKKQYLDQGRGVPVQSLWTGLAGLHASSAERCGYPTQKPEALLERVIRSSSNEGDCILDPYCGSGTTLVVAKRLNRSWIGIDSSLQAVAIATKRLAGVL